MERQDPYIGTGTLPPTREERSGRPVIVWIIVAVVVLGATVVAYFLWARDEHPLEKEPTEQPLPELKASDGPVAAALSALVGLDAFGQLFLSENLVRNIVATVDNLPSEKVSQRMNPVRSVPGVPATTGKGEALALAPANAARYAPYIRLAESVSTDRLVAFYRRHYPLFQQAYVELGYPNGYFNDRLVEAIDHLLATVEPTGPIRLTQPKVLYEFADPALEDLSAGQKVMLRIGKENRERVKAKLREIRAAVAR